MNNKCIILNQSSNTEVPSALTVENRQGHPIFKPAGLNSLSRASVINAFITTGIALSLIGCASTKTGSVNDPQVKAALDSAVGAQEKPFEVPYDPGMGQIVVVVAPPLVSAAVPVNAGNLGQLVRSQLADYLSQSKNLIVADREALVEISEEHKLAARGVTDPRDRPVAGRLAGARFLIKVDVTDFKEDVVGKARGSRVETGFLFSLAGSMAGGLGGDILKGLSAANPTFGKGKETVHGVVGLELRVVDVDTGVVVKATRASGSLSRSNTRSVLGLAGFSTTSSGFDQSVVAQAMRRASQDAVHQIHAALRERVMADSRISKDLHQTALVANPR